MESIDKQRRVEAHGSFNRKIKLLQLLKQRLRIHRQINNNNSNSNNHNNIIEFYLIKIKSKQGFIILAINCAFLLPKKKKKKKFIYLFI